MTGVDPLVGQVVGGRFRIEEQIGQGGMGAVYLAEHLGLGRRIALKIMKPEVTGPESAERFRREALMLARLKHENAVHIYDYGSESGTLYIAMELLEGESLESVLAREGTLEAHRAAHIAIGVLDVLAAAHALGMVHRDLKPANLFVRTQGGVEKVKVLDFGLAILLEDSLGTRITRNGQVFGTPTYMAPEQCVSGHVDARADLYALGCVVYELLTGLVPFDDEQAMKILIAQVHRAPTPPRIVRPDLDIPPRIEAVVLKAMAKVPAQRYPDAAAMGLAFQQALGPAGEDDAALPERTGKKERATAPVTVVEAPAPPLGALMRPVALVEAAGNASMGVGSALGEAALVVEPVAAGSDVREHGVVVVALPAWEHPLEVAAGFIAQAGAPPVLVCGPEDDLALMAKAIEVGAFDYVPMPLDPIDLAKKVNRALRRRR